MAEVELQQAGGVLANRADQDASDMLQLEDSLLTAAERLSSAMMELGAECGQRGGAQAALEAEVGVLQQSLDAAKAEVEQRAEAQRRVEQRAEALETFIL
jgi:hypothetical protein